MISAASSVDAVTLLALYHTGYNVVGVAILLPLIIPFTRMIERIVPERGNPLTRCLDPASRATSVVAVEAGRRTVARVLEALCSSAADGLESTRQGRAIEYTVDNATLQQTSDALQATRAFLSHVTDPPPSDEEQRWFISTLHALDHTIRLVDVLKENIKIEPGPNSAEERRAVELCANAMRNASSTAALLVHSPLLKSEEPRAAKQSGVSPIDTNGSPAVSLDKAIAGLEHYSTELTDLLPQYRRVTLESVASGVLNANDAIGHVEAARFLDRLAHHAWRATAHIAGAIVQY
jgi:phosphate:Na+ symporter